MLKKRVTVKYKDFALFFQQNLTHVACVSPNVVARYSSFTAFGVGVSSQELTYSMELLC